MQLLPERDPLPRLLAWIFFVLALLAVLVFRFWGRSIEVVAFCPLRRLIGLPCPSCGGTHVALALARGDVPTAFALNPLLTTAACLLALWIAYGMLATLIPAWRRQWVFTEQEKRALRWLAWLSLLAGWAYQILSLAR
jgi:hypothetical protein